MKGGKLFYVTFSFISLQDDKYIVVLHIQRGLYKPYITEEPEGYVKLLQGMMSMADFIGKFSEGYKCCYVCEIEEFETLPQGAKSGIYENTLLFGYTSTRTDLVSFLCFVVLSGKGSLKYEGVDYELGAGDCVFIDCRKAYSHSTSDDLWSLQWCHFYAPSLPAVYEK